MTRYVPQIHDHILLKLHKAGLSDYEISEEMNAEGYRVSYDDILKARLRLKQRPNRPPTMKPPKDGALPRHRPDPLTVAQRYLPNFDRLTMTVRGKPARLDDVMRQTNAILKAYGMEQMAAKPEWVV